MKVYVVYHMESGYETTIVAVYDSESKAQAYVDTYQKNNGGKPSYQWLLASFEEFELL